MSHGAALLLLLIAALLEVGADALIRTGLHRAQSGPRFGFMLAGGLLLFVYGYTVNAPGWDFGRLLGLYVVFFFCVAQLISWLAFDQKPATPVLLGGAFIIIGGMIISSWRT